MTRAGHGPQTRRDGWGSLALPRMNAHLMVVIAAALTTAVTAMLAGALAVLAGQAMPVAVRHDLAVASGTTMLFSGSANRAEDTAFRQQLPRQIDAALDGTPYTLYHATWSDPLGFTAGSGPAANGNTEITDAAAFDAITSHAVLVAGAWPGTPARGAAIPAALPATAAAAMRVHLGDTIKLKDRDNGGIVRFQITGLYRPAQAAGPGTAYWQLDLTGLTGVSTASGFSTFGPLTVQPAAFTGGELAQDQASWLAEPVTADLPQNNFSDVAANLNALRANLANPSGPVPSLALTTSLPTVLTSIAANLDVARSLVAICAILLALLGAAVLLAVARLLYGQREGESAMLAARGATRGQLLRLTATEALPLCVLASAAGGVAGIWLARVLAKSSALPGGPLARTSMSGQLTSAGEAAAAVAVGALVVMLIPALSRVTPGTARVRRGRQAAISAASRAGVDIGLIALAVLTSWQLRHYSAVSAGANGTFGVDPVVAIAPALALAGGTVVALRLLPIGGKAGDRLAARGRRLTTALASWQISRQPIRQGGAALLIVLAVATATLALTQRQSWLQSGHDQAAFTAGADVTVQSVQPLTEAQAAAMTGTPGVRHAMPVAVYPYASGSNATVVAIEAAQAPSVVLLRSDQARVPASTLFGLIRSPDQRPGVPLPGRSPQIQLTARFGPASLRLGAAVVAPSVEDADGVVYQLASVTLPADGLPHAFTIPVTPGATAVSYPLRLVALNVTYTMPAGKVTTPATFQLDSVSGVAGSQLARFAPSATSSELAGAQTGFGLVGTAAAPTLVSSGAAGAAQRMVFRTGYGLSNNGPGGLPAQMDGQLTLTALAPGAVVVMPGIATQAYLSATGASVGSTVQATIGGAPVGVHIVAAVPSFPTLLAGPAAPAGSAGASALIVDLASAQNFLTGRALDGAPVTQWWLATADHAVPPGLTGGLPSGTAVASVTAVTNGLLNDPLSALPQQALLGLAIAALLLASTGFCVSIAAGVRQRAAENALLAALGVAPRAAAGQLCLEKFMLSLPSALAGLALGVFLSELLVPAITLSPSATTPQPPVLIEFGWVPTVAAALALAIVPVLAAALVMVRRPDPAASLRAAEAV